jgi:hypothetical protein
MSKMVSDAMKSNDGSYIGVQTAKGHYSGGEMLSGFVRHRACARPRRPPRAREPRATV